MTQPKKFTKEMNSMNFDEKMKLLETLKDNPNESRTIIDIMTYQEKVKITELRSRVLKLAESVDGAAYGVDLKGESLDDYIKRNNLIPYETVKKSIENIMR